jgi:CO/xanthine dehydrogenase Mo-binding subunit
MALHRGRGFASINYPIGMNLGGDPSQALIHSNPDGKFTVALSAIDLGQGMKSVTRQIAAETLGVPVEDVYVDTADSDTGPHDMGSFASRGTHRMGNAVIMAAREARSVMLEAAAEELEVDAADLVTDGRGNIHVRGAPGRSITTMAAAQAAQFKQGRTIAGRGIFLIPLSDVDPDTGEMTPVSTFAHAAMLVEVEVDDETGEVTVTDMKSAYEVGRALNPRLVEQQLRGGAWMGMSHAAWETTEPYYPQRDHGPVDFNTYLMPGPGDLAPHHISILERPAEDGPYGGKGPGEMCANPVLPAVVNAIYDAVGVRIDELPATPEKILRGLKAARAARGRRSDSDAWWSGAPSPASTARKRWPRPCAPRSTSPMRGSPPRPISRSRSASRCCWKARRAWARPRRRRRSPPCSDARWCGCRPMRGWMPRRPCTSGISRGRCSPFARRATPT